MSGPAEVATRAGAVAAALGGELRGADRPLARLLSPAGAAAADAEARRGAVVALFAAELVPRLAAAGVGAVVLPETLDAAFASAEAGAADGPGSAAARIVVGDARLALARLSRLFDARPRPEGRDPSARVDASARLGEGVALGPCAVVGAGAEVGAGSRIGAGAVVGAGARLGRDCRLHANATVADGVTLGDRVILHSGAVIGADGFGYAPGPGGAEKIHHLGGVVLGDDVEIGAGTAIDRGTLEPTRIGDRTKIDNLCQIGHNVAIGSDCLIAGTSAVAGSTRIGRGCVLGGAVRVADHLTIGDGATIAGNAGVTKDVPAGATWAGFPARPHRRWVRELYLLSRLERIWEFVRARERE